MFVSRPLRRWLCEGGKVVSFCLIKKTFLTKPINTWKFLEQEHDKSYLIGNPHVDTTTINYNNQGTDNE